MSGAKTATVSSGGGAAAAGASGAAALGTVALAGGAIVIGAAVVVGTAAAARAAELKYHDSAIKKCRRRINDTLQRQTIKTWATSGELAKLQNCQSKLNNIVVPDDLAQARAANGRAAELLRQAEDAAKPAILRHEITQACEDMREMLSKAKHKLAGQQPLLSKIEQLATKVSHKNEMNATEPNNLRREQTALWEQCQYFKKCVSKFDELADYLDTIKQHDWAANINVDIRDKLAHHPNLTTEQIKQSFDKLIKEANNAFDQYRANREKARAEAQDKQLEELHKLGEEIEQRALKLQQFKLYEAHCQDIISKINKLITTSRRARYNNDVNTIKECLSQFDTLTESLPETAKARQQSAEKIAEALATKQDKMAFDLKRLTELLANLDLPETDYEYELQDLENQMNNLSRANPDEESLKQAEDLESDIETRMKRLPLLKMHYLARSLFKSLGENVDEESLDELEPDEEWTLPLKTESGEERELVCVLEENKLKVSLQVAPDDTLEYECRLNDNGDVTIQKTDNGDGESCEAFKKWRSLMAEVATAQGLVIRDEHGQLIESIQEEDTKRRQEDKVMAREWE